MPNPIRTGGEKRIVDVAYPHKKVEEKQGTETRRKEYLRGFVLESGNKAFVLRQYIYIASTNTSAHCPRGRAAVYSGM
jgi:hypothetical protein